MSTPGSSPTLAPTEEERSALESILAVLSRILLFTLIFGFASTIDIRKFKESLKSPGIFIGVGLQLIVMPLIGFGITRIADLSDENTIIFMILLSSPGGALSNLLNSLFNGDLSLSIAMTTVSTIVSLGFLPFNLFLYLGVFSDDDENLSSQLDFVALGTTCLILVAAVILGLTANVYLPDKAIYFYRMANIAGVVGIGAAFFNANNDEPIWQKPPEVFIITATVTLIALLLAIAVSLAVGLEKPAVFSVAIEVAVQNQAVSITFAFAAFSGDTLSDALAIPIAHTGFTTIYSIIFSIIAYRLGWTYSPEEATLWQSLVGFHQPSVVEGTNIRDTLEKEDLELENKDGALGKAEVEVKTDVDAEAVAEGEAEDKADDEV